MSNFISALKDLQWHEMEPQDLEQVLQIERNTQITPWSRLAFEESLTRTKDSNDQAAHCARVLRQYDEVLGFYIISRVLDELHILNLAIHPSVQGRGLGHRIMQEILAQAIQLKVRRIFLEVRQSNHVAQSLYQKWQFSMLSTRKDYYRTETAKKEDAIVLVHTLGLE